MSSSDALFTVTLAAPTDALVIPRSQAVVIVRTGEVDACDGGWHRGARGDAMLVSGCRGLRPASSEASLIAFAWPDPGPSPNTTRIVPAAQLRNSPRSLGLAQLLEREEQTSEVTHHLVEAFRLCLMQLLGEAPPEGAPCDEAIRRAIGLVDADLSRRWPVAELARSVGLSRAAFARRFRAALDSSPERYFTALRLERAAHRLLVSDDAMTRVASDVGYASPFAFHRAFKRRFGITPGLYRRRGQSRRTGGPILMAA